MRCTHDWKGHEYEEEGARRWVARCSKCGMMGGGDRPFPTPSGDPVLDDIDRRAFEMKNDMNLAILEPMAPDAKEVPLIKWSRP